MKGMFFELLQISLGNKDQFENFPSDEEWKALFDMARKQSLASLLFIGVEKVLSQPNVTEPPVFYPWFGILRKTCTLNRLQNERAKTLASFFEDKGGFRSCILKGQGTALYYEKPECRQCGDIDIWVEGDRDRVLGFIKSQQLHIGQVDMKHSDVGFFKDIPVEVHFLPSWMYCPFTNTKLQRFFKAKADSQFANIDKELGFAHTTLEFDLVFSMVHIYRHIFSEGIGLRQLVDYYFILLHSSEAMRNEAFEVLYSLKMKSFVGGIMWILTTCFGMSNRFLLCEVNERHGSFLLSEIMSAGSFGHYDARIKPIDHQKRFKRGMSQLDRNLRFLSYYPSEVLWSPVWKLCHWYWRKSKGYL